MLKCTVHRESLMYPLRSESALHHRRRLTSCTSQALEAFIEERLEGWNALWQTSKYRPINSHINICEEFELWNKSIPAEVLGAQLNCWLQLKLVINLCVLEQISKTRTKFTVVLAWNALMTSWACPGHGCLAGLYVSRWRVSFGMAQSMLMFGFRFILTLSAMVRPSLSILDPASAIFFAALMTSDVFFSGPFPLLINKRENNRWKR